MKRKDGPSVGAKPVQKSESPLDVEGIDLSLSSDEIVEILRESRER